MAQNHIFTIHEVALAFDLLRHAKFDIKLDARDQALIARAKAIQEDDGFKVVRG